MPGPHTTPHTAMDFVHFRARAQQVYDEIPPEFREGVDGLEISRATVPHPTLPDIYTLGECRSEYYPSEFGGPGEVRSIVALYYGSFVALARLDADFDWEAEVHETVTHEVRHHLESLAAEDALEEQDYAEDQNFLRRDGDRFDPFFYRMGHPLAEGCWEVGGDVFVERSLDPRRIQPGGAVSMHWRGQAVEVPLPDPHGDVHFVRVEGVRDPPEGELLLVLLRRRGLWNWIQGVLRGARLQVLESEARVGG